MPDHSTSIEIVGLLALFPSGPTAPPRYCNRLRRSVVRFSLAHVLTRHLSFAATACRNRMDEIIDHTLVKRSQESFPSIKPACDKARHLFAEGKLLRDMIEHADRYIEGKGRKQAGFVREVEGVATDLPGDAPGIADATSTIVDKNGHWLGGRLNVERVMIEVRAIAAAAAQILAPTGRPPRQIATV
jgi:hypothetical protein